MIISFFGRIKPYINSLASKFLLGGMALWAVVLVYGYALLPEMSGANKDSFIISFFASSVGDAINIIIFIIAIGLIKEKEAYDRMHFENLFTELFSVEHADQSALDFSRESIRGFACYCSSANIDITILERIKDGSGKEYFYISCVFNFKFRNMFPKNSYTNEFAIRLFSDLNDEAKNRLSYIEIGNGVGIKDYHEKSYVTPYEGKVDITIPENGENFLKYKFSICLEAGEWFIVDFYNFTRSFDLNITNSSTFAVDVEYISDSKFADFKEIESPIGDDTEKVRHDVIDVSADNKECKWFDVTPGDKPIFRLLAQNEQE